MDAPDFFTETDDGNGCLIGVAFSPAKAGPEGAVFLHWLSISRDIEQPKPIARFTLDQLRELRNSVDAYIAEATGTAPTF